MHARWARFTAATALTVAVAAGGMVLGTGSANAAEPIIVGSCATTVQGAPGTPVELSPAAVLAPVVNVVQALDPLNLITPTFRSLFAALPPIPLGALPTGSGWITGGQIANDVIAQLNKIPLLGPILGAVVSGVQSALAGLCNLGVTGANAVAAPIQDGTAAVAQAANSAAASVGLAPKSGGSPGSGGTPSQTGNPGGGTTPAPQSGGSGGSGSTGSLPAPDSTVLGGLPLAGGGLTGSWGGAGSLLDYGLAESPLARYAGIPFASAGLFAPSPGVRYGGDVTGYAPSYGVLGQDSSVPPDGVQTAGHAEAYNPGGAMQNGIGLPMLLAVLALAGVTAALVRTWVLRRVRLA